MNDVVVGLCTEKTRGEELKKQATLIARALFESKLWGTIASIRVTNDEIADGDNEARVRCESANTFLGAKTLPPQNL